MLEVCLKVSLLTSFGCEFTTMSLWLTIICCSDVAAIGCSPIEPPYNAWVKADHDHAIIQCNETEEAWFLACENTHWVGHVGNCSHVIGKFNVTPSGHIEIHNSVLLSQTTKHWVGVVAKLTTSICKNID